MGSLLFDPNGPNFARPQKKELKVGQMGSESSIAAVSQVVEIRNTTCRQVQVWEQIEDATGTVVRKWTAVFIPAGEAIIRGVEVGRRLVHSMSASKSPATAMGGSLAARRALQAEIRLGLSE